MLSRRELESAIKTCEEGNNSYQNCEKLATLYTIYDHLYTEPVNVTNEEETVGDYGVSDFLMAIRGRKADKMWSIMDEMMSTIHVTNPRLYDGVMRKVTD